jgi:hypothetical protein
VFLLGGNLWEFSRAPFRRYGIYLYVVALNRHFALDRRPGISPAEHDSNTADYHFNSIPSLSLDRYAYHSPLSLQCGHVVFVASPPPIQHSEGSHITPQPHQEARNCRLSTQNSSTIFSSSNTYYSGSPWPLDEAHDRARFDLRC